MNSIEAREKISTIASLLKRMQEISSFLGKEAFIDKGEGQPIDPSTDMATSFLNENKELMECWSEIQKILPPGYSVNGNLIRHLSFNQAGDWYDISYRDIPNELNNIEEYKKLVALVEYVENLHPKIARVSDILLNGDIDAALKTAFAVLDSEIRFALSAKPSVNTFTLIAQAFKDGKLVSPHIQNNDAARNFLQGVIGYYRNIILHNPLPTQRNRIDVSLSLLAIAHEAFILFEACSKIKKT